VALFRRALSCSLVAVALIAATPARADDAQTAARLFREGKAAFDDHDYRHAAERFEEAYATVPHPSPLWNAARSWERAGDTARATELFLTYAERWPEGPDIAAAREAFGRLQQTVGWLELPSAQWPEGITVDGVAVKGPRAFVTPGAHVVEGRRGTRIARASVEVAARERKEVRLALEEEHAAVPPPPALAPAPQAAPPPEAPPARHGWSPVVVYVTGGVAVFGGLATAWSGVDTQRWKTNQYDVDPSKENLDEGKRREVRTNLLLGATLLTAAFATVAAVFLVDWRPRERRAGLALTPTGVAGTF
jgi:hypothetical protein